MGSSNARKIISEVAAYYVEREIAVRLESESRPIAENDLRDMQSFCAVVPYADEIIAENQFASLAKQGRLDKKYDTRIATSIFVLRG